MIQQDIRLLEFGGFSGNNVVFVNMKSHWLVVLIYLLLFNMMMAKEKYLGKQVTHTMEVEFIKYKSKEN
jgi:hypothetical protein